MAFLLTPQLTPEEHAFKTRLPRAEVLPTSQRVGRQPGGQGRVSCSGLSTTLDPAFLTPFRIVRGPLRARRALLNLK